MKRAMSSGPSSVGLVDTHAHLADRRYRHDWPGVLHRARAAGVVQVVVVGTDVEDSRLAVELAGAHDGLFAAAAVHPNDAAEASPGDFDLIAEMARSPRVVAVGETGLDRYWDRTPFDVQVDWLRRQMELAAENDLPVILHCRDAYPDIIAELGRLNRPVAGVLHSFTGSADDARALLGLGLHISFAGMITFANKALDPLREVAATVVPDNRILVETDSPYLSPHPFRGTTNEPSRVAATAEALARLRGHSTDDLARITTENARNLFRLDPASALADG
jgi:TatD DNase family protein